MSGTIILLKLIGETIAFGAITVAVVVGLVALYRGRRFKNMTDVCRQCTGTGTEPYTDQPCTAGCDDGFIKPAPAPARVPTIDIEREIMRRAISCYTDSDHRIIVPALRELLDLREAARTDTHE